MLPTTMVNMCTKSQYHFSLSINLAQVASRLLFETSSNLISVWWPACALMPWAFSVDTCSRCVHPTLQSPRTGRGASPMELVMLCVFAPRGASHVLLVLVVRVRCFLPSSQTLTTSRHLGESFGSCRLFQTKANVCNIPNGFPDCTRFGTDIQATT